MDQHKAEQLVLALMKEHGLLRKGWRFKWSNGKRQLGCAEVQKRKVKAGLFGQSERVEEVRTIKLSRNLVALNDEDEVRDTILHEIAHAIAGVERGHDAKWKAVCKRIGAKPQRLAGEDVKVVTPPLLVVCDVCEKVLAKRHRRMQPARLKRVYCRHCGPTSMGKVSYQRADDTSP